MYSAAICVPVGRKHNATDKAIHLQEPGLKPDTFKNICGNGNGPKSKNYGKPEPDSVFFNALLNATYRCCPTCIKLAIAKEKVTVVINFESNIEVHEKQK